MPTRFKLRFAGNTDFSVKKILWLLLIKCRYYLYFSFITKIAIVSKSVTPLVIRIAVSLLMNPYTNHNPTPRCKERQTFSMRHFQPTEFCIFSRLAVRKRLSSILQPVILTQQLNLFDQLPNKDKIMTY
jgi:hypothetical protein